MKHARSDYDRIQDPLGKIPEDEPVFLLRGQDALAPGLLRQYAHDLMGRVGEKSEMVSAIFNQADKMDAWQKYIRKKLPDMPKGVASWV